MDLLETPKGLLQLYASGNGALSFNYCRFSNAKDRGAAPGDLISCGSPKTVEEVEPYREALKIGPEWTIGLIKGELFCYEPVTRIGDTRLSYSGRVYFYDRDETQFEANQYTFFADFKDPDEVVEVKNLSTRGALLFFLANEAELTPVNYTI